MPRLTRRDSRLLSRLNDRMLEDIGVRRVNIDEGPAHHMKRSALYW